MSTISCETWSRTSGSSVSPYRRSMTSVMSNTGEPGFGGGPGVARFDLSPEQREKLRAAAPKAKGLYVYRVVAVGQKSILTGASNEFPIRVRK